MLFPRYFKIIGLLMLIPSLIMGLLFEFADYVIPFLNYHGGRHRDSMAAIGSNNMTDEVVTTALIIGLCFIGFGKQKNEKKNTDEVRLKALFWAVLVHGFLISILMIVFDSGIFKFNFIESYESWVRKLILDNNLFVLLIIFIFRFYYLLYKGREESPLCYISYRPLISVSKVLTPVLFIFTVLAGLGILVIKWLGYAVFLLPPTALIWVWSAEKSENETIEGIRLRAMLLSVIFNYTAFIVLTWVIYGIGYLLVSYISLASIPLAFIPIFYWLKFRHKHQLQASLS